MYKILNNFIEQPFFEKIIEIAKFFKLQKTYWSVASIIIIFLIGQVLGLIRGDKIEQFTQQQIQNESIHFLEKIFWYVIEFIFANGAWWALVIGILLLTLVTLIKYYETKYSSSTFIDSILYNKHFESFDVYEHEIKQSSDNIEYINDKNREDGIIQIRSEVDNIFLSRKSSFIRIEGFSGIGKTRFVYESLNDKRYKEFV